MDKFFKLKALVKIAYNRVDLSGKKCERGIEGTVHAVSKTSVTIHEVEDGKSQLRMIPFDRIVTATTPHTPAATKPAK